MKRLALTISALLLLTFSSTAQAYHATIKYTQYGVPHITGENWGDLGFGYGYAFAKDNICTMAEQYVTVRAERSKYFGPTGSYLQRGNGFSANNLNSDFFWQRIIDDKVVEKLLDQAPPLGPTDDVKEGVRGYVAGWNRYLDSVGGTGGISDPTCKGKPWVTKITEGDAYRRFYQLILLASQGVAIDGIATASPTSTAFQPPAVDATALANGLAALSGEKGGLGSNAVAIGRDGMQDHTHGLLLGNPHFPWLGTERFWQFQYTIPKKVNVSGMGLFGVPLALIGYTNGLAWSHTVSTAYRFTPIQLTIDPTDPTHYLVDGQSVPMIEKKVTVPDAGGGRPATRTLYWTKYGPIMTSLSGIPLPWTNATAFAMEDANADNFRAFNHFIATDQAQSTQQLFAILKRYQGIPWVNTIAADKNGNALYADIGSIPNVSNDQARVCNTALGQALTAYIGLPVLDGSRSSCDWGTDPDAVKPGIFGPSHEPYLFRSDYVTNSNDSYWLSNPNHPLEGFARIIGDERTARSLRTRMGLVGVAQIIKDGGFTRQRMQEFEFSDRALSGELAADSAVAMCRQFEPTGYAPSSNGPVPIGNACEALAGWDKREDSTSTGALLWRRFWAYANGSAVPGSPVAVGASPWVVPFNSADPVNTPNTLNTASPRVQTALGDAITDLRNAKIPFDAPLGSVQYVTRDGQRIPLHGGPHADGVFNVITNSFVQGQDHLTEPVHGSSYIQIVTWKKDGCPDAATILTYSQSTDPTSPHFADQTRLFSQHGWNLPPFCARDVVRAPGDTVSVTG